MKKYPKPWHRTGRGWYVQLGTEQVPLGKDEAAAFARYHEIMAGRGADRPAAAAPPPPARAASVLEVCDRFVTYCKANKAPQTAAWYHKYLKSFLAHLKAGTRSPALDLCPADVTAWTDAMPWGPTTRRQAMTAVARCLAWAGKQWRWTERPLAGLEKPEAGRRESPVTPAAYAALMAHVTSPAARDLLAVAWETGARPQEILRVERRHFAGDRWEFPKEESKGKKRPRTVLLTDAARAVCERLAAARPDGPLFRNADGNPWTPFAVSCLLARVAKKTGTKFALYDFRHGAATRLLKAGNNTMTVAALLGHSTTDMLAKHYSHVHRDDDHLKAALRKGA